MRFVHKPTEVEAVRYGGPAVTDSDNGRFQRWGSAPIEWLGVEGDYKPCVRTIHGHLAQVAPGDWLVTEPDGIHHYPVKPDIFDG